MLTHLQLLVYYTLLTGLSAEGSSGKPLSPEPCPPALLLFAPISQQGKHKLVSRCLSPQVPGRSWGGDSPALPDGSIWQNTHKPRGISKEQNH